MRFCFCDSVRACVHAACVCTCVFAFFLACVQPCLHARVRLLFAGDVIIVMIAVLLVFAAFAFLYNARKSPKNRSSPGEICFVFGPSVRPSVQSSVRPSIRLSVPPSVRPSVFPSVCLSVCPSLRPSVRHSVRPSVYPTSLSVYTTLSFFTLKTYTLYIYLLKAIRYQREILPFIATGLRSRILTRQSQRFLICQMRRNQNALRLRVRPSGPTVVHWIEKAIMKSQNRQILRHHYHNLNLYLHCPN